MNETVRESVLDLIEKRSDVVAITAGTPSVIGLRKTIGSVPANSLLM